MSNTVLSKTCLVLSVAAAVLAALDAVGANIWLSANSWLLVAAVLGIWAVATKSTK